MTIDHNTARINACPARRERGATMVEFALVIPIFIVSIFVILFVGYVLAVRSVANTAVERALSIGSVDPDIYANCKAVPVAQQADCGQKRAAAMNRVLETARTFATTTMLSALPTGATAHLIDGTPEDPAIEFILSSQSQNNVRAYYRDGLAPTASFSYPDQVQPQLEPLMTYSQNVPPEVKLTFDVHPFFWFTGPYRLTVRAVGYPEPTSISSFPRRTDCRGNAVPPGGSSAATCPCGASPNDQTVIDDPNGGGCICAATSQGSALVPVIENGQVMTCVCPGNAIYSAAENRCINCNYPQVAANNTCQCPPSDTCIGGQLNERCECICSPGQSASNGRCCNDGTVESNGMCCPPDLVGQDGKCECPSSFPCGNGTATVNGNSCSCECPQGAHLTNGVCCQGDLTGLGGTQCGCPAGAQQNGNTCQCGGNQVYSNGQCSCPASVTEHCSGGYVITDPATGECSCHCNFGQQLNAEGVCVCAGNLVSYGSYCWCDMNAYFACYGAGGNPNFDQQTNNCSCTCAGGATFNGSQCQCTGGQNYQPWSGCTCPGTTQLVNGQCGCSGGATQQGNNCTCSGGRTYTNGACTCLGGSTFNGTNCVCSGNQNFVNGQCVCPNIACGGGTVSPDGSGICSCHCGNKVLMNGICCNANQHESSGICCNAGLDNSNGVCCGTGQHGSSGICCSSGLNNSNGVCCGNGQHGSSGICCDAGRNNSNGVCCRTNEVGSNGSCVCSPNVTNNCGGGTVTSDCVCQCPTGATLQGSQCVCSISGQTIVNGACQCQAGTHLDNGLCCADGTSNSNGVCCPPGQSNSNGICCPTGQHNSGGTCCANGTELSNGVCCGANRVGSNNTCVCDPNNVNNCGGGTVNESTDCKCVCPTGASVQNGQCVCPNNQVVVNGQCGCNAGQVLSQGLCCNQGQSNSNGICCSAGQSNSGGICCSAGQSNSGGICCPAGQSNTGGICCAAGQNNSNGVCCSGNMVGSNGQCVCPNTITCSHGVVQATNNTCACACQGHAYLSGTSVCLCPLGSSFQTPESTDCYCPPPKVWTESGTCERPEG